MSGFLVPLNYVRAREVLQRLSAFAGYSEEMAVEVHAVLRQSYPLLFARAEERVLERGALLLELTGESGKKLSVIGASIGGGRIQVRRLGSMPLCFSAEQPTLIVNNEDQPGSVADVSRLLAEHGIHIATFQVNRSSRGGTAVMVIECDATLSEDIASDIRRLPGILNAVCV